MPIHKDPTTASGYAYRSPQRPKPKRVWLAVFVCGVVSAVAVTMLGLLILVASQMFTPLSALMSADTHPIVHGGMIAVMLCAYNLILFPIVLPVTWTVLALTLGRRRWKGMNARRPYYLNGIIAGALLVGLTTGGFVAIDGKLIEFTSAGLVGGSIGALSGLACTYLFLLISRPIADMNQTTIDAFS